MDVPIEILSKIDVPTILAMAAMLWFWNSRLDKKFDKIDEKFEKIDQRFEKINQRFEKIDQRFEKIDQRFDRLENRLSDLENDIIEIKTILRLKECCMIKDERQLKKAE